MSADVKLTLAVLVAAATIMILNETSLSVALPAIMAEYQVPATVVQWLLTGFMLTMAVVIPTTGFVIERYHPPSFCDSVFALCRGYRSCGARPSVYLSTGWPRHSGSWHRVGYSTADDRDHDLGTASASRFRHGHYCHCYLRGTSVGANGWRCDC